ncbi:ISAs1 family transposase, partial [Streptomyces sp. ISL-44]|uniref:ISAs1 family transposase n=1 Tax=Streptomyces sp. ISL-44 TaxID=2819184 RepID=UPI001BE6BCAD
QLRVPDKTNEITCFAALLEPYDLTGVTVTADALHTQRGHVRFLVEEKKAHYLLVVKANQPGLHRRLRSLPWKEVTARCYDREVSHGRKETRVTRALTVTGLGLDFPHAVQAVRVLRHRTDLTSGRCSRRTIYAITDLTSQQASPQRLGQLLRSQWTIENRLHFVRDTTFGEDASKIRRPRVREHGHLAQPGDQYAPAARTPQHRRRPPPRLLRPFQPAAGPAERPLTRPST